MKKMKVKALRYFLSVLFFLSFLHVVFAQHTVYKTWNYQNGLPDEDIKTAYLYQDGLVYFGSGSGIYLFNGEQIINPFSSINLQNVVDIFEGEQDSLIALLPHRIFIFHPRTYQYRFINFDDSIEISIKGGLFTEKSVYACSNVGLIKISPFNNGISFLTKDFKDEEQRDLRIFQKSICLSADQRKLYMGYQSGVLVYDLSTKKAAFRNNSTNPSALTKWKGKAWGLSGIGDKIYFFHQEKREILCYDEDQDVLEVLYFADSLGYPTHIEKIKQELYIRFSTDVFVRYIPNMQSIDVCSPPSSSYFNPIGILPLQANNQLYYGSRGIQMAASSQHFIKEKQQVKPNPGSNELQQFIRIDDRNYVNFKHQLIALSLDGEIKQQFELPAKLKEIHGILEYPKGQLLILGNQGIWHFDAKQQKIVPARLFPDSLQMLATRLSFIAGCWDSLAYRLVLTANHFGLFILDTANHKAFTWRPPEAGFFKSVRTIKSFKPNQYICGSQGHDGMMRLSFVAHDSIKIDHLPALLFNKAGFISSVCNDLMIFEGYLIAALTSGVARIHFERQLVEKLGFQELPYNSQAMALTLVNDQLLVSGKHQILKLNHQFQLIRLIELEKSGYIGKILPIQSSLIFFSASRLMAYTPSLEPTVKRVMIQHIQNGETLMNTINQQSLKLPHHPHVIHLFFGFNSFRSLSSPAFVEYRISPQKSWLPVYHHKLSLANLNPGKYQIEYRLKLQGTVKDHNVFTLEIMPPWYFSKVFIRSLMLLLLFIFLVMVFFYFRHIKKKNLSQLAHVFAGIEEERTRISREFHDGIGPNLSSIRLYAEYFKNVSDEKLRKNGEQISAMIHETIQDVRNIMHNLSPQSLHDHGLINAVKSFANQMDTQNPIKVSGHLDYLYIPPQKAIHLYRIIQELINNAIKHANASFIEVSFSQTENQLNILVKDNGIGLHQSQLNQAGYGWRNIQSRAEIIKAQIDISSSEFEGTSITITLFLFS